MSFAGLTGESRICYLETIMIAYYVYILASSKYGTLYIGVTSSLAKRVWEHKQKLHKGSFTSKYNVNMLVYFECSNDVYVALNREKRLKRYKREWKIALIEEKNPEWRNLYEDII